MTGSSSSYVALRDNSDEEKMSSVFDPRSAVFRWALVITSSLIMSACYFCDQVKKLK